MIDWDRVTELREEIGEEDFAEIAAVFLAELEETVDALAGIADDAARRDGYHGLKGAALNLGFETVAALCAAAEAGPADADLPAIATACRAASAELCARYPEIAA